MCPVSCVSYGRPIRVLPLAGRWRVLGQRELTSGREGGWQHQEQGPASPNLAGVQTHVPTHLPRTTQTIAPALFCGLQMWAWLGVQILRLGGGGHRRCKPSSLARAKNAFGTDGHVPHLGHPIQEPLATSGCWPPGTWLGPLRNSAFPLIYLSLGVNSSAVLCGVACRSWPWKVSTVPRPPPAGLCPAPCTPPAPKMNHSRQWQFSDYSFFFFLFL